MNIGDGTLVPFIEATAPGRGGRAGLRGGAEGNGIVAEFSLGLEVPMDQPGGALR